MILFSKDLIGKVVYTNCFNFVALLLLFFKHSASKFNISSKKEYNTDMCGGYLTLNMKKHEKMEKWKKIIKLK